jgi:OOP family OmpA-OmpF porin
MPRLRRSAVACVAALWSGASWAAASPCEPETRQSTCFDADALFISAAPGHFVAIAPSAAPSVRTLYVGADATFLTRPVVLTTRSPDPSGREVPVVNTVTDVALAAAYVPAPRLELSLIVAFAAYRSGTGLSGVTSQSGPGLGAAFRDVRLGAGYGIVDTQVGDSGVRLTVMPRLDLGLPTGDETSFAGEQRVLLAPRLSAGLAHGRFFTESEIGARLRAPVELGGARLGTELVTALGVGVSTLDGGLLDVGLEAWLRFTPVSQGRPGATLGVVDGTLAPSEWMLSLRTQLGAVSLRLGAGTAIPLSTETRRAVDGQESTEYVSGLTAPDFRAMFGVRYAPL